MSRPRAADDFATIRARMEELQRERASCAEEGEPRSGKLPSGRGENDLERRRRARLEGLPPPWAPTIFARKPRR